MHFIFKKIMHFQPTILHLATPLINFIIGCESITREDMEETRCIVAGAAPVGNTAITQLLDKVGHYIQFQEGNWRFWL